MRPTSAPPPPERDLLQLFAGELASGAPRFQELVLSLETRDAADEREEAMRLAHSLKGAARIIGFQTLVAVLHAAEDALTAGQGRPLGADGAQTLLRLVDLLEEMSRVPADRLHAFVVNRQPVLAEVEVLLRKGAVSPDAHQDPKGWSSRPPPGPLAEPPPAIAEAPDARGIRVAAESLTRLLGLAGEAVVEARRLGSSRRTGYVLERLQHRIAERASEIREHARLSGDAALQSLADATLEDLTQTSTLLADSRKVTADGLERLTDIGERLYIESLRARQRPFAQLVPSLRRLVRDSALALGKSARLDVVGASTLVDGDVLAAMEPILHHLLTNAVDHGIEGESDRIARGKPSQASIRVELKHDRGALALSVIDDGRGLDPDRLRRAVVERGHADDSTANALSHTEIYDFLFLPGFSTAGTVSVHSGRGVGLDVVRAEVARLGGRIAIESRLHEYTRFELALPVTRVVVSALLMRVAGEAYALPLARAGRVVRVAMADLHTAEGRDYVVLDGDNVGVVHADELLEVGPAEPPAGGDLTLVLLGDRKAKYGLIVDEALGEDDLVVRPLDARLGRVPDVAATAILADGAPTLLLDADDLLRSIDKLTRVRKPARARRGVRGAQLSAKRVIVVDDSPVVREAERQILAGRGYIVDVAEDGVEAWDMMRNRRYDLAVIDLDMPRMNGIELVRRIRRDTELASLPVVIVSYKDRDEDRLRATEVGVDHFLAKGSFEDEDLVRVVEELLGERP